MLGNGKNERVLHIPVWNGGDESNNVNLFVVVTYRYYRIIGAKSFDTKLDAMEYSRFISDDATSVIVFDADGNRIDSL